MKKLYTWAAKPGLRSLTVANLQAAKRKKKFTQITANTEEEAHAAGVPGIDMMICNVHNVESLCLGNN